MTEETKKFSLVTDARYLALLIPSVQLAEWCSTGSVLLYMGNEQFFGIDVAPHPDGGIILSAQSRFSWVMVRDPKGSVTEPVNIIFPKKFLEACRRPEFGKMFTENQEIYEVEESIPAFMQPGPVHVFYCGAYICGREQPPEDHDGSVLYSSRASLDEKEQDPWVVHIRTREVKSPKVWDIVSTASAVKSDSIITNEAMRLLSDTMAAHAREFWDDTLPVWQLEEFKSKHCAPGFRALCKGGVEIIASIAQANPKALKAEAA
ncbi:hypothetical protein AtDm6_3348 [Acetobacter tropicalis]|uniref:Uncharacterized protein n=2 Tax=Acetobacter tropicalis TaxID=104102 RepID=A0A095AW27_9PROT|nr:hypothetical protein [Acetobacter tropicalis]KGB20983.1 hypothetical protein AtDm6_3348 [Acetobacter tropicalis]